MSDSVQWTLLTPVVMLLVLGILQVGLWGYARIVAVNAAGAGAEDAAASASTAAAGEAMATAIAQRGGVIDLTVACRQTVADVSCRVGGTVPGLVDIGINRIDAQATRPRERVTTP